VEKIKKNRIDLTISLIIATAGLLATLSTLSGTALGAVNCEEDSSGFLCRGGSGSQGGGGGSREQCDFDQNTCEASGGLGGQENRGAGAGHNDCNFNEGGSCEFRGRIGSDPSQGGHVTCPVGSDKDEGDDEEGDDCDRAGEGH
jgi:hypothetical protein